MLTRSDMITLGMQVDVNKAYDLLRMFKEAGQSHIDIETILDEAAPRPSWTKLRPRLEELKSISRNWSTVRRSGRPAISLSWPPGSISAARQCITGRSSDTWYMTRQQ